MLDQFAQLAARLHHLRRQLVHFEKAPVEDDDFLVRIEHAQALRHVVEGRVEADVLLPQLFFGFRDQLPPGARELPRAPGQEAVGDGPDQAQAEHRDGGRSNGESERAGESLSDRPEHRIGHDLNRAHRVK